MDHGSCVCQTRDTDGNRAAALQRGQRGKHRLLTRREALAATAAGLALLVTDRLRAGSTPAALARTLERKFRPPTGSRKIGNLKHLTANAALQTADPGIGQPAVVVRLSEAAKVKAYSAVC